MCEFISWYESNGEVLFLTGNDVFNTKRGRELQKYSKPSSIEDLCGHGAIVFYYDIRDTGKLIPKECTDFSSPKNFPDEIVAAIKAGKMRGLDISFSLLSDAALEEYKKMEQAAWAECKKIQQAAWKKYEKTKHPDWAEYKKMEKVAWKKYTKMEQAAWVEYFKTRQAAFWDLFSKKKNRAKSWK